MAYYRYPQVATSGNVGAVKQGVIQLEVVSFANPYPYSKRRIGSLIRDFLLLRGREGMVEQYGLNEFEVNVLDLGRTATEKNANSRIWPTAPCPNRKRWLQVSRLS